MLSSTAILIYSLASVVISSPLLQPSQSFNPSPTDPDGTINPFFPCGITSAEVAACPYRCFDASTGSLLPSCYTASSANQAITSLQSICVKCLVPPASEPSDCQPLKDYFDNFRPSRCGSSTQPLPECSYNCAAAQVPFTLCDANDTSDTLRVCERCQPQCSSPRIVFQPGEGDELAGNFSISAGSCGTQYGQQQVVACPYRCKDVGNPNSYCSLRDVGVEGGFTECVKC